MSATTARAIAARIFIPDEIVSSPGFTAPTERKARTVIIDPFEVQGQGGIESMMAMELMARELFPLNFCRQEFP